MANLSRRLGVTTLYVTHDQTEALSMADRVAVLRRGVLQQIGTPAEVYGDPATLFVAAFVGTPRTNLLQGAVYVDDGHATIDLGEQVLVLPAEAGAAALAAHQAERITVALRADALHPVPDGLSGMALRGTVRLVENLGHEALVHLDTGVVGTSTELSKLEIPDTGHHLAEVVAEEPPVGHPLRNTLARMLPHGVGDKTPPTARTEYGFYPVYDPDLPGDPPPPGDVVLRVPAPRLPRVGEPMTVSVDLGKLLLFDRAGERIRLS